MTSGRISPTHIAWPWVEIGSEIARMPGSLTSASSLLDALRSGLQIYWQYYLEADAWTVFWFGAGGVEVLAAEGEAQ